MEDSAKISLRKALEEKYNKKAINEGEVFVIKNASKPYAPIIPEEIDKIIQNVGTAYNLRTGTVAYTIHNKDLIVQFSP